MGLRSARAWSGQRGSTFKLQRNLKKPLETGCEAQKNCNISDFTFLYKRPNQVQNYKLSQISTPPSFLFIFLKSDYSKNSFRLKEFQHRRFTRGPLCWLLTKILIVQRNGAKRQRANTGGGDL